MNAHPALPRHPLRRREIVRLAQALGELLTPLDARLYRDALRALALAIQPLFPPRYKDPAPLPDRDTTLSCLLEHLRVVEAERAAIVGQLAQLGALLQQMEGFSGKRKLLSASLAERHTAFSRFRRWGQVRKYYDADSLLATYSSQRTALDQALVLGLKVGQGLVRAALETERPLETVLHLLKELGLEGFLVPRVLLGAPAVRREALVLLKTLLEPLPTSARTGLLGAELLRNLHRCQDAQEEREIQRQAFEVGALVEPDHTLAVISSRLQSPSAQRDDFHVRRHLVRLLGTVLQSPASLGLLRRAVRQPDGSEAVRMAVLEAVGAWSREDGLPLVEDALLPAGMPRQGSRSTGDPLFSLEQSPRVRSQAALVLGRWLEQELDAVSAPSFLCLCTLLEQDEAELVRRTALEVLLSVGLRAAAGPDPIRQALCQRLRLALEGLPPPERTRCAEALELLLVREDPTLSAALDLIAARVQTLSLGRGFRLPAQALPLESPEAAELALGRILALLTRDDFGLYARRTRRGWTITRGEHFVRRLWRVLYEVTHRTPNKRQGFLHTIGRHFGGELRAHPAGLAEITATTVPGERVLSEREGAWGRYLPLPDDLLCLPLFRSRPVRLFSAEGITEILPPPSFLRHLAARAELTRDYARFSALRRQALSALEPEEQGLYLRALQQRLGIEVRFVPHGSSPPKGLLESLRPLFPEGVAAEGMPSQAVLALTPAGKAVLTRAPLGLGDERGISPSAQGLGRLLEGLAAIGQDLLVRVTGSVGQLALLVLGLLVFSLARGAVRMQRLRRARNTIPLVVGGWGTRGKSGTERLKAAMFQGMGYEVLVKTTGCEAMVIHALPDSPARELFLYRPYDKATIWEQADCLELAARLKVQVFLYECMALQPRYVRVIQNDWSRDDVSTLTNCYPDHEDIQGPAGVNVAWCISEFIREGGRVLTSEEQMLPVLKEAARLKGASLLPVPLRTADLIPRDYLERLPYQEHPRNVGLVLALGQELGFEPDRVLLALGDHVVPDIGVLKAYPYTDAWGRHCQFVSGNSANERTGFMSNWVRMGFGDHDPATQGGDWIMTVVNNRADRVARSQVFAEILVRDTSAHRHVLIGTNLSGLQIYIRQALERRLPELLLFGEDDVFPLEAGVVARRRARFQRLVASLKVPGLNAEALVSSLKQWLLGLGLRHAPQALVEDITLLEAVEGWLASTVDRSLEEALQAIGAEISRSPASILKAPTAEEKVEPPEASRSPEYEVVSAALTRAGVLHELKGLDTGPSPIRLPPERLTHELIQYFLREVVRASRLRQVHQQLELALVGNVPFSEVNARFQGVYRALFLESVWVIEDAATTGDQIIRILTAACPPGVRLRIMGTQNIKGTGLDFVYRWASIGTIDRLLKDLSDARRSRLLTTLTRLQEHPDYGLIDACRVQETLLGLKDSGAGVWLSLAEALDATLRRISLLVQVKQAALEGRSTAQEGASRWGESLKQLERILEPLESVRRRDRARQLSEALVAGILSQDRAAEELRLLNKEQKGGWLKSRLSR